MAAEPGPSMATSAGESTGTGAELIGNIQIAKILELLECPVCFDVVLSPILLCENGHSVCSSCKENLATCPVCKDPFTTIRNLLAEEILSRCPVACKNKESGCQVILLGGELSAHHQICDFRLKMSCILFPCNLSCVIMSTIYC